MTTRAEVVAEAREWIGTPFVHQAALKGIGADCAGLARGIAINTGIFAADIVQSPEARPFMNYGRTPDGRLVAACRAFMEQIPFEALGLGDALLLRLIGAVPQHVAVITNMAPMLMVHAWGKRGVERCVEQLVTSAWRGRIDSCWRFRGVI